LYASTAPLGEFSLKTEGGIYQVNTKAKDIGDKTISVKIKDKAAGKSEASEFYEETAVLKTGK
jgi:hypothetical protein